MFASRIDRSVDPLQAEAADEALIGGDSGPASRLKRYLAEMLIGLVLAALVVLALIATVGSVPFIYQGF